MVKTYYGAITIFYKKETINKFLFLINKNLKNGNYSLIGGTKNRTDTSLKQTAKRENKEELGISPKIYKLISTKVRHKFIFSNNKPQRQGQKGSYLIFLADLSNLIQDIRHKEKLRRIEWVSKKEAINKISFDDLKEVFKQATDSLKHITSSN